MPQPKQAEKRKTICLILTFQERMVLLQLLPAAGDIISLRLVRELREMLSPTEVEAERYEVKYESNVIRWNEKLAKDKEFEIVPRAFTLIESEVKRFSDKKQLPLAAISLYEKFCEHGARFEKFTDANASA